VLKSAFGQSAAQGAVVVAAAAPAAAHSCGAWDQVLLLGKARRSAEQWHAAIHTLGGLYDSAGENNDGLPAELIDAAAADPRTRRGSWGGLGLNVCPASIRPSPAAGRAATDQRAQWRA
jgi:hypothetical protein